MKKAPCSKCFGTGEAPDQREIGLSAWKLRTKAGLTMGEVAERMGVDRSYLSYLEAGKRGWSPELLARFKDACEGKGKP